MRQKILFLTLCALLFSTTPCFPQPKNEFSISAGFSQLKDEFNQGLVYNGPQISVQYQRNWLFEKWELRYKPKFACGLLFNRKMDVSNINFVPVDFSGIVTVFQKDGHTFRVGLNLATNYSYQMYSSQHMSNLFWYSEVGIAPCVEYTYQWKQSKIKLFVQNSLAGFVSRTESIGHYFYSFKFADFFVRPHQNMKFGSFDKYNHTNVSIEYFPNVSKKHSIVLGVAYIDYYFSKRFQTLNYYLQWKISF
ncbi:MAG: hypothetical protein FWC34_05035 [Bacteroidetes bacterium]|nr:hypothetical protein [Bacteroidota bacterium]MCL2301795.1 hypothetical protein [Lentimicrobiaceae bacterium]